MNKLIQTRLKERLSYNLETGIFTWISSTHKQRVGQPAGCINTDGYRVININGYQYRASILAWLYVEGYWPEHEIDHKDRIRDNDKWDNLKHVTRLCNSINRKVFKNNKSGITGICFDTKRNKWRADIRISKKLIFLGRFKSITDAVLARWRAEVKYNFSDCNMKSSAHKYLIERGLI